MMYTISYCLAILIATAWENGITTPNKIIVFILAALLAVHMNNMAKSEW